MPNTLSTTIPIDANTRYNEFSVGFRGDVSWRIRDLETFETISTANIRFNYETGEPDYIRQWLEATSESLIIEDPEVIYEWVRVLTEIYNTTGFLGMDGQPFPINIAGNPRYIKRVEDIAVYGGWYAFDLRTRDDWLRRKELIKDGAEASGLSLNYTELPVVNGIKLIPGAKWITNIFYDESIDGEAWFDTVGNIVHR